MFIAPMDNKIIEIKFLTMWRKLFWMLVLFVVILFISERKEIAFNTNAAWASFWFNNAKWNCFSPWFLIHLAKIEWVCFNMVKINLKNLLSLCLLLPLFDLWQKQSNLSCIFLIIWYLIPKRLTCNMFFHL